MNGHGRIKTIAKKFKLPEWWVEAVLIEYYPCREFLKGGNVGLFNFDLFDEEAISSIASRKVVVSSAITLFHNIRLEDIKSRIVSALVGRPIFYQKADIIPEGPVNLFHIPWLLNPIDVWDPKLAFSEHALVFDNGTFYQWRIAEFYPIEGTNQGWWRSPLFDLDELKKINDQIQKARNTEVTRGNLKVLRKEIQKLYAQLEAVREGLREEIWKYHESQKKSKPPAQLSEFYPPLLTTFDSVDIKEGKYRVRTHLEPLLYRASLNQLSLAEKAAKKRATDPVPSFFVVDEIEASAVCILCAYCCLEAYVNSLLQDCGPDYWNVVERMNVVEKWFILPHLLGSKDCFMPDQRPFKEFQQLNGWRNDIAHFSPRWERIERVAGITGKVGRAYAICNARNAAKAVNITRAMIQRVSTKLKIPRPVWLEPEAQWLKGASGSSEKTDS